MATKTESRRDPYIGEVKNHLRHGYGIYNYDNNFFRYEGEWKNGKKHGHGKLVMGDGGYYEGEFQEGEIEGHGFRLFGLNGNKYSGQFHMGEMHGQGIMTYADATVYEGQWIRNNKQGFGIFRGPGGSIYQGNIYQNKRHGEGTQIYSNGDRYDGDWVQDKRQGHGEIQCLDGTMYDGQWANDNYNGQGAMHHSSGVIYEGLWINGKPANMAVKLAVEGIESYPLEIVQGTSFELKVVCQNEEGRVIPEEGRELRLSAGFKYQQTVCDSKSKEATNSGLFDVIEDVEEKIIPTPFGYDIVSYPITDQIKLEEFGDEGENVQGAEEEETEETTADGDETTQENETQKEKTAEVENTDQPETEKTTEEEGSDSPTVVTSSDPTQESSEQTGTTFLASTPLPPPVGNVRTASGNAIFQNLVLTAAPPMYRPFLLIDEEKKKKAKDGKLSKRDKFQLGDERFARPVQSKETSESTVEIDKDEAEGEEEPPLNENTAPPGEYVLLVEDCTNPKFMNELLVPVFLQVNVVLPKKTKKPIKKKDKGPSYSTNI